MLSVLRAHISPNLEISAITASRGHAYQDVIRRGSGSLPSRQQTVTRRASKQCPRESRDRIRAIALTGRWFMAELSDELRRAVWLRDGYRCQECGVAVAQKNGCK